MKKCCGVLLSRLYSVSDGAKAECDTRGRLLCLRIGLDERKNVKALILQRFTLTHFH